MRDGDLKSAITEYKKALEIDSDATLLTTI